MAKWLGLVLIILISGIIKQSSSLEHTTKMNLLVLFCSKYQRQGTAQHRDTRQCKAAGYRYG